MSNAISLLRTDYRNNFVFAKSGITENKPLQGRPYGGCGIFICKSFPCISNMVETNCNRICAVLSEFTSLTILFIYVYMPGDTYNNTDEFNSVLSGIQALQEIYNPVYMICGGDFNTGPVQKWVWAHQTTCTILLRL